MTYPSPALTAKPFLWRDDLIELRARLHRGENRVMIERLARHLVMVYQRSAGLLRGLRKLA